MKCQENCAACCIAPTISSPLPGMPMGKPANTICANLDEHKKCKIFDSPLRPNVCHDFSPTQEICGQGAEFALQALQHLENMTTP